MEMRLHHVGCLVEDIGAALSTYAGTPMAAGASEPVAIRSQKVRVCLLPTGNGTFLEFVEPDKGNSVLQRMLREGTTFYHAAYVCGNLEECVRGFVAAGAHELTRFQAEVFEMRWCVYLITEQQQMIELIEEAA